MISYITLENTPIHKFDILYRAIVKNFQIPESIPLVPWMPCNKGRGIGALLSAFFSKWYLEAHGSLAKDGLNKMAVIQAVNEKTKQILARIGVHELIAKAVQAFVSASLSQKHEQIQEICAWMEGQPVTFKQYGLTRRIDGNLARDFLRSLALISTSSAIRGTLLLLDEAERVMDQTPSVRKKSYGVIRDLLDNADNQGGMPSSMIYIAATPEMFTNPVGFAEYDALRSRLAPAQRFTIPSFMDWRAVIVDLVKTPLPHDHLVQLALKVRSIHSVARQWDPSPRFTNDIIQSLINRIESNGSSQVSKPRMLSSLSATLLEVAEQNPSHSVDSLIDATFNAVCDALIARPAIEKWS